MHLSSRWILSRLLQSAITLVVVLCTLFFLFRMLPGDPTIAMVDPLADPLTRKLVSERYGLDRPLGAQFIVYVTDVLHGDFGASFYTKRPVMVEIAPRLTNTLVLVFMIGILSYVGGTVLGFLFAFKRGLLDTIGSGLILFFRSMPPFWLGLLFIMIFSYHLGWLPLGGLPRDFRTDAGFAVNFLNLEFLKHALLPVMSGTLYFMGLPVLLARSSLLEVIGDDFVDLARAKGLSEMGVLFKHAARTALLPVVTQASLFTGVAIGGLVTIEYVFSWPGVGQLMVISVTRNDYPVAQAAFFILSTMVISINLLVDTLYGYLDPRVR